MMEDSIAAGAGQSGIAAGTDEETALAEPAPLTRAVKAGAEKILDFPLLIAAAVIALVLPWIAPNDYIVNTMILLFVWAVVTQMWNLLLGVTGIFSLAQLAFFVIGAYTSILLSTNLGVPQEIGTIVGGVAATALSLIVGLPTLRLKGIYVVLLTISFSEIVRILILTDESGFTGGSFGLYGFKDYSWGRLPDEWRLKCYYYVGFLIFAGVTYFVYKLIHSPIGLAFKALRDAEGAATARGISPFKYKLLVFATSAFFTGVAGAFYANYLIIIAPSVLNFGQVTNLWAMIVVGGTGTFGGPIIGTAVLVWVTDFLRQWEQYGVRLILMGVILVVMVVFLPTGMVKPLNDLKRKVALGISSWMDDGSEAEVVAEEQPVVEDQA